jgi:hypothetical protein
VKAAQLTGAGHKEPQRGYALGRAAQLASDLRTPANQAGAYAVQVGRQILEPDQIIAAETEAEKYAARLKAASGKTSSSGGQADELKNPATITKQQWKTTFARVHPLFAQGGVIQMRKSIFLQLCGEPQRTQTVGNTVFWYYECKDGEIQLELDNGNLAGRIAAGRANDY